MSSQFAQQATGLRQQAYAQMRAVQSEAFRTLARERGGVSAKNREAIEAEAKAAGRAAAEQVYLAHGYRPCAGECGRLASPSWVFCPACEDAQGVGRHASHDRAAALDQTRKFGEYTMVCDNCQKQTSWTSNEWATRPNEMWCAECNRASAKDLCKCGHSGGTQVVSPAECFVHGR